MYEPTLSLYVPGLLFTKKVNQGDRNEVMSSKVFNFILIILIISCSGHIAGLGKNRMVSSVHYVNKSECYAIMIWWLFISIKILIEQHSECCVQMYIFTIIQSAKASI